jgi:hypothetical protein
LTHKTYAGVGNDVNIISHQVRRMQWQLAAICNHLHVIVAPDVLDETLNPSPQEINKIIAEARFAGTQQPIKVKRRRKKRL